MSFGLTDNQLAILSVVAAGNSDGSLVDFDQLLERLASSFRWVTTKQSMQFSLRRLIAKGFIKNAGTEVRRKKRRRLLRLTIEGWESLPVTTFNPDVTFTL